MAGYTVHMAAATSVCFAVALQFRKNRHPRCDRQEEDRHPQSWPIVLENQFGPEWAILTRMLSDIRPDLLRLGLPAETITERTGTVLDSEALALIRQGQENEALSMVTRILLQDVG